MNKADLLAVIRSSAFNANIDPELFLALCIHESSLNPWAVRYEPAFYTRYVEAMKGLSDTEKHMRATSFGLCQIMGQVAREKGFDGKYLTEILDPLNNTTYGARKFKDCLDHAADDVNAALLRWNGGGDPKYPDLVLQYYKKGRP